MIRRVASIIKLGFRAPFSSRFVWALLCVLGLIVVLLPANLKSDGTTAGQIRMILTWTFGPAFFVLAAATMWSGCAALSSDIEEGRHTGTAVSPARTFEIWLGRWIGLTLTNAVVLLIVAAGIWAQLRICGLGSEDTAVERRLDISRESVQRTAQSYYDRAEKIGEIPPELTQEEVLDSIKHVLDTELLPIEPGQEREWEFVLRKGDEKKRMLVAFHSISSLGGTFGATGEIRVYGGRAYREPDHEAARGTLALHPIGEDDAGRAKFEIPAGSIPPGNVRVVYKNTSDGISVLIRHTESMVVSVPGGGVVKNLVLCAAALLSLLSALAGIGVALGALFSFPVAAFTGVAVILTAFVVGGGAEEAAIDFGHSHGGVGESAFVELLSEYSVRVSRVISKLNKPFIEANVFDRLGDGVLIDLRHVLKSAVQTGVLLPLVFGVLAALALRRREL